MGRYSSVQAYADNNSNVRSISYQEATGSQEQKKGAVKAEKVSNPYGSTAGAGSGDFHVYRHARAREAMRWQELDASEKEQQKDIEFHQQLEQNRLEQDRKTNKNRKKRQREKAAKLKKKSLEAVGINRNVVAGPKGGDDEEEFTYVPVAEQTKQNEQDEAVKESDKEASTKQPPEEEGPKEIPKEEIPNDGSFLEMMKKKLAASQSVAPSDADGGAMPPPAKKRALVEARIIDEDDEEGPMLPPGYQ